MHLQKQIYAYAARMALAETGRYFLWLPVALAAGILLYFAQEQEPSSMQLLIWPAITGAALFALLRRRNSASWLIFIAIAFSGFAWAKLYTDANQIQMLKEPTRIVEVQGQVKALGQTDNGWRITLSGVNVPKLKEAETPSTVRLNMRGKTKPEIQRGDIVKLRAGLMPPSGPVMRGGFDFARFFFFREIGAVGYAVPPVTVEQAAEKQLMRWDIQETRSAISERLMEQLGPRNGAVASALMIGDRTAIPDTITEHMRITNLSHILAISGMHMALVTGIIFIALRGALAWMPWTQHNPHNKKIAAGAALFAGLGYLLLSGIPISAARAYVMVALLLGAILLDREVQPMRSLAWAALILLVYNPANVLEPGFQLSFLATMGLIAWYEQVRIKPDEEAEQRNFLQRCKLYLGAILLTTLVAELVTAPLVLYHFNNASFYGMLANLIVMPIVAFIIMPSIVLTYLLWGTALSEYTLHAVGYGIEAMLIVAQYVAELPYAEQFLPAPTGWGIVFASFGLVWLCLMQQRWRFWGLLPIILGTSTLLLHSTPDFYMSHDRAQIALKLDGELQMVKGRGTSFAPRQWAHGSGTSVFAEYRGTKKCDKVGCIYESEGKRIGVYEDYKIVPKGYCPQVDVLLATFYWNGACEPDLTIDRDVIERFGTHWGWWNGKIRTTDQLDANRPWSRY